jgi:cytosine/adenosine deaminase-related metal-dependent hydrolase
MRRKRPIPRNVLEAPTPVADTSAPNRNTRREFLKSSAGALGLAAAGLGSPTLVGPALAQSRRIVLKDAIVLSLDPKVGDFEKADVLIEGKKISQIGPNLNAGNAERIDCTGMIVMPGFVTTHHHQFYTLQRSLIPDGLIIFPGNPDQEPTAWPHETYGSVPGNIWTQGRIPDPANPGKYLWDLGRPPYDPEDNYLSELVACLSEITQGITCGTDTSQANHSPEYTDALIQGLVDSGRRTVFDYGGGADRGQTEFPGAMGDATKGIGRIAKKYFSSKDQLVTLGCGSGAGPAFSGAAYTGWQLGRSFGAYINNHAVGNPRGIIDAAADARNGSDWSDVTFVHATRWQDNTLGQIGPNSSGYPNNNQSRAWEIVRDRGAHVSIAVLIEQQMRHGMPPFQAALNHGILPSLSADVDTNMTPDPFSLMRGAFCCQRGLANDLAFKESNPGNLPIPQLVTARQCIEMATVAGAAGSGLLDKIGTLTPGKEADIVVLDANTITIAPMNNVPGAIVTMMDTRNVRHVMIAGKFVFRNGKLVGWDEKKLVRDVIRARDRVLARINSKPLVGAIPAGLNSLANPYRPNFLDSCCHNGLNTTAAEYKLRP